MRDESQTTNARRRPTPLKARGALIAVCALVLALFAIGCGSDDSDSQSTATSTPSSADTSTASTDSSASEDTGGSGGGSKVDIVDFDYDPKTITVSAGDKVSFVNEDSAAHTATADDGSFDTGTLNQGDTADVTLKKPGTFTYFCRFHAFMQATVEVK